MCQDDHLFHRHLGKLGRRAAYQLRLPDGSPLQIYRAAPPVSVTQTPYKLNAVPDRLVDSAEGSTIATITKFASDASGYIQVVEAAVQLFSMLEGLGDETSRSLVALSQQLKNLEKEVGAVDYLDLLRDMDKMRVGSPLGNRWVPTKDGKPIVPSRHPARLLPSARSTSQPG